MILTGNEIKLQHEAGSIVIEPWDDARVNPNSYNVSLAPLAGSGSRRRGGAVGLQSEKLLEVINVRGAKRRLFLIAMTNSFWTTSALVAGRQ